MKQILIAAFIMIVMSMPLLSQPDFDYSGYVYDLPIYNRLSDIYAQGKSKNSFANLTRTRFRPEISFGDFGRINVEYEIDLMYSDFGDVYSPDIPITNRQAVRLSWTPYKKNNIYLRHYIDRLSYKHIFDWGEFVFGRQRISWGVGRIWQPTDLFNPINPANFSKFEKDGADAASLKIYLGLLSDLEVVYNFREKWKDGNYGARLRTNYGSYDLSIVGGYFDKRIVIGGDFDGNLFNAGFRGEAIYAFDQAVPDSNYLKMILGLDYQFSGELYGLIELHYNGQGTTCKACYAKLMEKLARGEIQNIGKFYAAEQATYTFNPLLSVSFMNITNIGDGSGFVNLLGTFSPTDDINISTGGMFFFGGQGTEYRLYPGSVAAYLIGEYFF